MRKWLNKNKIFFEIAASLSVIYIAIQANIISQQQIEIQKNDLQPHFAVYLTPDQKLIINHKEGKFRNLELTTLSTLNYSWYPRHSKRIVLLDNFRNANISPADLNRPIDLELINESDSTFVKAKKYFEDSCQPSNDWSSNFDLQTYLNIEYTDFEGELKNLYYMIDSTLYQMPEYRGEFYFFPDYETWNLEDFHENLDYLTQHNSD